MKKFLSIVIVTIMIISLFSACDNAGEENKKIIINEVMASNQVNLTDEDGEYSDWIELYNQSDEDINLKGYSLSDNEFNVSKWKFPQITIKAKEYLVVFASGKDKIEEDGIHCHTNYKLSAAGENLILSSPKGDSDVMAIPPLESDVAYGRAETGEQVGIYGKLTFPTPGQANSGIYSDNSGDVPANVTGSGEVLINEYMPKNTHTVYDIDGDYSDWVELYNPTDAEINLSGYFLSTKMSELQKWAFPAEVIAPKSYLLIWLSGKNKVTENREIHANFKLGEADKELVLSSRAGIVDYIDCIYLPENVSRGRNSSNEWSYFSKPTPGKENFATSFTEIGKALSLGARGLWISEVSSVSLPYNNKQVSDWIEIYNGSGQAVNLSGYGLSSDLKNKYEYTFGNVSIESGGYIVVYATGPNVPSSFASKLHAPFTVSSRGEVLYLTDQDGYTMDVFHTGRQSQGYTSGRTGSDEATRYFFMQETPGAQNPEAKYLTYSPKPEFSNEGGYIVAGSAISINSQEGVPVYYTTDGSEPSVNSTIYSGEIPVTKNTVIKAKTIKEGVLPSDTITATYFTDRKHNIPIISISMNNDDFYGSANGIYANKPGYTDNPANFPFVNANFWQDWERKMTFEYYGADGVKQVDFDAGLKIFGQYSKGYDQKSMSVHLRGDYGNKTVTYPFFEGNDIKNFSNFVIRSGGQDYGQSIIKDPFAALVMKGQSSLIYMDWQPVALYVNGEYFGFYSLREKINESYLQSHLGIDENNVDIIKGNTIVLEGTIDNYASLIEYVKTHDLSNPEYYKVVENWVDIDNYIDYLISEIYFSNGDTGNVKFYRERKDGAKWQWVMFDFDMTLRNDVTSANSIGKLFNPAGHGSGNMFSSVLQVNLLKNETFKNKFIERYAFLLNNVFVAERMTTILDGMVSKIDSEIPYTCERWGKPASYDNWKAHINTLRNNINTRRKIVVNEMKSFLNISEERIAELFTDWASLK